MNMKTMAPAGVLAGSILTTLLAATIAPATPAMAEFGCNTYDQGAVCGFNGKVWSGLCNASSYMHSYCECLHMSENPPHNIAGTTNCGVPIIF